jgi:DNA-binding NarL/FixJ family response regulator
VRGTNCTSVYIVAEVTIYREGLSAYFETMADCEVVGSASTLTPPPAVGPDVYIVDCTEMTPSDLTTQRMVADQTKVPIVVLGLPDSPAVALSFLEAGAAGYVRKDASLDDLHATVCRAAQHGHCLRDDDVTALLIRLQSHGSRTQSMHAKYRDLTPREREVALLMKMNRSNKEIAQELGISVHTVKNHVHNALSKLGIDRRYQADRVVTRLLSNSP